ncbi:MAG: response regulator [Acidobacteriota bacterium]
MLFLGDKLTLIVTLCGVALCWLTMQPVDGVELFLAPMCYLAVAMVRGLRLGLVATAAAVVALGVRGVDPWLLTVLLLEGAMLGWLGSRQRSVAMLWDLVYWLGAGVPILVVGWLRGDLILPALLAAPFNSILCLTLASVLLSTRPIRAWLDRTTEVDLSMSLGVTLRRDLIVIGILPVMLLAIVQLRLLSARHHAAAYAHLEDDARVMVNSVEAFLDQHRRSIVALANEIGRLDFRADADVLGADLDARLSDSHRIYGGFITMLAADARDGRLIGFSPERDAAGVLMRSRDHYVDDRAYFQEPLRTGQPYISDVFRGRGFGQDPIVAMSAPATGREGVPVAVVEGSVDLRRLGVVTGDIDTTDVTVLLLDDRESVIWVDGPIAASFPILQALSAEHPLRAIRGADTVNALTLSIATGGEGVPQAQTDIAMVAASRNTSLVSWRTVVMRSRASVSAELHSAISWLLGGTLGVVVLAVVLANLRALRITRPLERLLGVARTVADRGLPDGPLATALGETLAEAPSEISALIETFDRTVNRVRTSYVRLRSALGERDEVNAELRRVLDDLDLTVQARTQQLAEAVREAKRADEAKGQFLARVSHEIRTPMNAIIGLTGLLLDSDLQPAQYDCALTVRQSAQSLLSLINDILDFSKIEAGKVNLEITEFPLRSLIEEVWDLVVMRAHDKGLRLAHRIAPDVPQQIVGDATRLRQVLVNLVANAVKFTDTGEVTITVTCADPSDDLASEGGIDSSIVDVPAERLTLRFEVRDTGVGISADDQQLLFAPFAQIGDVARKQEGTGLGLSICRQLVTLMGGTIDVSSNPGAGSCFFFTLPVRIASSKVEPEPIFRGRTVLVADPHAPSRGQVADLLRLWGVTVREADSAADLRARMDEVMTVDHVLIDRDLPDGDGLRIASRIYRRSAADDPGPALLLMVPLGSVPDAEVLQEAGVRGVLTKPVRGAALRERLRESVGGHDGIFDHAAPPTDEYVHAEMLVEPSRILVVDDNAVNQKVARLLLERDAHRVDVAANGQEALEVLLRIPYDLVLMDCEMPVMDGYTAATAIRRLDGPARVVPVVAMTAHATEGERERCLRVGMSDYLAKPVSSDDLRRVLARWLPGIAPGAPRLDRPITGGSSGDLTQMARAAVAEVDALRAARHDGDRPTTGGLRNPRRAIEPTPPSGAPRNPPRAAKPEDDALAQRLAVLRDLAGDERFVGLIERFRQDTEDRLRDLDDAIANRDAAEIEHLAHSIRGSSSNLGAERLASLAQELERRAGSGDLDDAHVLLSAARHEYTRLGGLLDA